MRHGKDTQRAGRKGIGRHIHIGVNQRIRGILRFNGIRRARRAAHLRVADIAQNNRLRGAACEVPPLRVMVTVEPLIAAARAPSIVADVAARPRRC